MNGQSAKRNWIVPVVGFLSWAVVLGLAYSQAPLYTSNQNQYFLHGAASAGVGFLEQDWLANTGDPTVLFSFLVDLTYRLLNPSFFYLYYVLLFGVYLYSLYGIIRTLFDMQNSRTKRLAFLACLIFLHSALLRFFLTTILGPDWAYLFDGGVASQRLLGPVFQPSNFGVLLILSLYLFLRRQIGWAVAMAALAASLHPTYLLSAAMLTLAYMTAEILENRSVKNALSIGVLSLALVTPILAYTVFHFSPTSAEATAQAQNILVNFRIPHHTIPSEWLNGSVGVKLILILAGLWIARKSRLFLILTMLFGSVLVLTLLQVFLQSDPLALLFPWRLSALLVPVGTALVCAFFVEQLFKIFPQLAGSMRRPTEMISLLLLALIVVTGVANFYLDSTRMQADPARPMWEYVADHKQSGEVYLIPPKMQEFRLNTGAPAFIEFKSIPYKDVDVLAWHRRVRLAQNFYRNDVQYIDCDLLDTIHKVGDVTHVVLGRAQFGLQCDQLQPVYRDQDYALFALSTP